MSIDLKEGEIVESEKVLRVVNLKQVNRRMEIKDGSQTRLLSK